MFYLQEEYMAYIFMLQTMNYKRFYCKLREVRQNLDNLEKKINEFRDERDWRQFHNEKDLAISISLEASELLELFQWNSSEETIQSKRSEIEDELADVLIYSMMFASNLELNVEEIILNKLEKNKKKYPVEKSKGNKEKYTDFNNL